MKFLSVILCACALSCQPDCEPQKTDAPNDLIVKALNAGEIVTVDKVGDATEIEINGVVTTTTKALTTGCFGIPECVAIDDTHRGIIKMAEDNFSVYDEAEEVTGTTYFLTTFYNPYWVGNGNAAAFRAVVDSAAGGAYENKRLGCCANNPDKCHCL